MGRKWIRQVWMKLQDGGYRSLWLTESGRFSLRIDLDLYSSKNASRHSGMR